MSGARLPPPPHARSEERGGGEKWGEEEDRVPDQRSPLSVRTGIRKKKKQVPRSLLSMSRVDTCYELDYN